MRSSALPRSRLGHWHAALRGLPQHPGTRCFIQRGSGWSGGLRVRRLWTVPAARSLQEAAGTGPHTPDWLPEAIHIRGPTSLTHGHQMRPWCRHAGAPSPSMGWGSWFAIGDPRHSTGCSHSTSHSPAAPCMRPGRTGLVHSSPGSAEAGRGSPEPTGTPSVALERLARGGGQRDTCMVQKRLLRGLGPFLSTTASGAPVTGTYIIKTPWSYRSPFILRWYF